MSCFTTIVASSVKENIDAPILKKMVVGNCALSLAAAISALVIGILTVQGIIPHTTGVYFLISAGSVSFLGALISFCYNYESMDD